MAGEAAQLLDQLMGSSRNAVPGEEVKQLHWSDDEVCKLYVCGFCPSDLFVNTKAEASVGPCFKVHDEHLKKMYEQCDQKDKDNYGYEDAFMLHLERLIRDLDRKVERGRDRLRRSAEAKQQALSGDGYGGVSKERLKKLSHDIDELVLELRLLGDMGRVEETQALMQKLEGLERERDAERVAFSTTPPKILAGFELDSNDFHEKMELCDVCGSFLVIGDTQSRVDAHLLGKQHLGFARIRSAIADLKTKKEERFKARIAERDRRYERDETSRYRRYSHRSRSRERRSSRDQGSGYLSYRSRRSSRRSRSSSMERRRSRSRSRGRVMEGRTRSRRSRSKSRDRHDHHSSSKERSSSLKQYEGHKSDSREARTASKDQTRGEK